MLWADLHLKRCMRHFVELLVSGLWKDVAFYRRDLIYFLSPPTTCWWPCVEFSQNLKQRRNVYFNKDDVKPRKPYTDYLLHWVYRCRCRGCNVSCRQEQPVFDSGAGPKQNPWYWSGALICLFWAWSTWWHHIQVDTIDCTMFILTAGDRLLHVIHSLPVTVELHLCARAPSTIHAFPFPK